MKKILTCVSWAVMALAAGEAAAQSSVTAFGLLDVSAGTSKAPGANASVKGVDSGKMTTSYIGFKGNEDLGGGLSALFQLESFLRADAGLNGRFTGDNFWARNALVGLSSKELGTVKIGRNTTTLFVSALNFNAFGDSFGYSPTIRHIFSSNTVTGDSGWSDSVLYTTPSFGGFTASAFVAAGEGSGGRNVAASGTYVAGPLGASLVYQKVRKDNGATPVDDTTTWMGSGSYDFGVVKLFAQYAKATNDTKHIDYKISELGASVPIGQGKLLVQYGQIRQSVGAGRKTWSFGYDYWLSKRTDMYLVGMSDRIDGLSAGNSLSVGMRHRF